MTLSLLQNIIYGACFLAIACYALYQVVALLRKRGADPEQTDELLLKLLNGESDNDEKAGRSI